MIRNAIVHRAPLCVIVVTLLAAAACGSNPRGLVPPGTSEPDKFLFDKGTVALNAKKWLTAREFFKQVTETYTQSSYRPDAKLGTGDTYLGEGTSEALVLAINEFREFLTFYPTNPRADYAQFKLGMAHFKQMRGPQRDQSETREAVTELQRFVDRYPNSTLFAEGSTKLREARIVCRSRIISSATSISVSAGIPGRSIASNRCSRTTKASPAATRFTSISRNVS